MDNSRSALPNQRPPPPQRALSGSYALQQGLKRTPIPSRLNNVRSFSHPVNVVDLTADAAQFSADVRNSAAFMTNQDAIITSPDVIELSEEDVERPAKRAKTNGHAFRARASASEADAGAAHHIVPGSPLPQMRRQTAPSSRNAAAARTSRTVVDRVARRAHGLDPPSMATRLPAPRNVADFSPWSGNHPEDIMNETVVKAGYYDKVAGPNSTESNSAKPTIWPNLSQKNNMGLQTLSYLFSQVMEKRQQLGRCTAPSTFKPPPRVTVTDTKREAWLRDLANPDVPLRKQSRTIPHGIRGKPLMDHCLIKEIPLPRAVWLAKCVGANELRAFRRKGVSGTTAASGELKWIRDWTVQVELFLDSVIADCGRPDWQAKMDYSVKLASSFYTERLLERDHYLDWIVSSFSQAAVDKLPVWIILAQLYWKDITSFGRRGRQLADAILENLHQATLAHQFVKDTLRDRLKKLIVVLAVTNRACLILPRTWEKYRHLLAPQTLSTNPVPMETPAQNISKRNSRLVKPLSKTPRNMKCPLLELYTVLDAIGIEVDYRTLTATCMTKVPEAQNLISAILDWTASVYRSGESRIYIGAKLIIQLHDTGVDTDVAVLEYLRTADSSSLLVGNVHRVIAELARAGCFFPGRYLQWLMTSGVLHSSQRSDLIAGLLTALPLDALPPHLLNTRNSLMRRLGHQLDEDILLSRLQAEVTSSTGILTSSLMSTQLNVIESLSGSARLEFGRRLAIHTTMLAKDCGVTLDIYCRLRESLERCNDLNSLGQVMQAAMCTEDVVLLATIGDTVSLHAKCFAAAGSLQLLIEKLLDRYKTIRAQQLDRNLILALTVLVQRCQDKTGVLRLLENDLALCEQQSSMAVYSPASDSLTGMQASHLDSDNDIDAVFVSGNTMDEQLMQRVFNRVVQRAGKTIPPDAHAPGKVCGWLNQLRALDIACFNLLVQNFAQSCLQNTSDSVISLKVTSALIASGSLSFEKLVNLANDADTSQAASFAVKMLTSKVVTNDSFHAVEAFRFRVQQSCYRDDYASKVLPLLTLALKDPKPVVDTDVLANLVLEYFIVNEQEDDGAFASLNQQPPRYLANLKRAILKSLNLATISTGASVRLSARPIVALATPLSVVHCAAALEFYARGDAAQNLVDADELQKAILEAVRSGCEVWPQLLDRSGQDTIKAIYHWAKEQLLNNVLQGDGPIGSSEEVKRYLDILDVAHHFTVDDDEASVVGIVTDKLKVLESRLSNIEATEATERDFKLMMASLQILLHLSILFSTSSSGVDSENLKQNRANLLAALCALLVHVKLQPQQTVLEYIHDVASAVADSLPGEMLQSLAKCASTGITRDFRLASILGNSPSPDAWLALVTHVQPQGTQQQRALMKQQTSTRQVPQSPISQQKAPMRPDGRMTNAETKTVPFPLRRWEIMSDATPTVGDNDTSLSLSLFGARKV